jgi:hypothetical protein
MSLPPARLSSQWTRDRKAAASRGALLGSGRVRHTQFVVAPYSVCPRLRSTYAEKRRCRAKPFIVQKISASSDDKAGIDWYTGANIVSPL